MRKTLTSIGSAIALIGAVVLGSASTATAAPSFATADPPDQLAPEVMAEHPGAEWYAVSPGSGEVLGSNDEPLIEEPAAEPESGTVTPFLIDTPADWTACFVAHDQLWELDSVNYWGSSSGPQVKRIQCGYHDSTTDTGFGWHHIQARHQGEWQGRIDQIDGAGGAWDDLMAFATKNAIEWPLVDVPRGSNNTRCVSAPTMMYDADGDYVYTFNPSAVFATDSDRVITSIPSSSSSC